MISQILQRDFIEDRLKKTKQLLSDVGAQDDALAGTLAREELDKKDWRDAITQLVTGNAAESAPHASDSPLFLPQSAELSIFQSALEQFYEEQRPDLIEEKKPGQGAGPEQAIITSRRLVEAADPEPWRSSTHIPDSIRYGFWRAPILAGRSSRKGPCQAIFG